MGPPKQRWTSEEEDALRAGIARHGVGKWLTILKDPEFSSTLCYRSNVDLKDKWRNMKVIFSTSSSHGKAKTTLKRTRTTPKNNEHDITSDVDALYHNSQILEISSKTKGKRTKSSSGLSKRLRSSSNQLEALSISRPSHIEKPVKAKGNKKVKPTKKKDGLVAKNVRTTNVRIDSPSMGTRSKKTQPPSPAMSTRSKPRLSL